MVQPATDRIAGLRRVIEALVADAGNGNYSAQLKLAELRGHRIARMIIEDVLRELERKVSDRGAPRASIKPAEPLRAPEERSPIVGAKDEREWTIGRLKQIWKIKERDTIAGHIVQFGRCPESVRRELEPETGGRGWDFVLAAMRTGETPEAFAARLMVTNRNGRIAERWAAKARAEETRNPHDPGAGWMRNRM